MKFLNYIQMHNIFFIYLYFSHELH